MNSSKVSSVFENSQKADHCEIHYVNLLPRQIFEKYRADVWGIRRIASLNSSTVSSVVENSQKSRHCVIHYVKLLQSRLLRNTELTSGEFDESQSMVAAWRSVLQCVAVCRSVLQCVAVCRSVSQCVAVCCSVLQCVAVCRSVSQCVAVPLIQARAFSTESCIWAGYDQ